jgi:site-specific DNA recombinase
MKKAIAYIRVSTDNQASDDKFGLDAQRMQINSYAEEHSIEIIEWVADEGESGAKTRPGFDKIIYGDVSNPPCEAVIVAKNDRVARDINIYFYYKMMLKKKDIELISIAEDFGQFGAFSSILEAFTLCVAEMERENITKRTTGGRMLKAAQGGYAGGKPPMGYQVKDGALVKNPSEAEIVKMAFRCKNDGLTMRATADVLNDLGLKNRKGKNFTFSNIQTIWNNENTFKGYYKYGKGGEWVKGQHEPYLAEDGTVL